MLLIQQLEWLISLTWNMSQAASRTPKVWRHCSLESPNHYRNKWSITTTVLLWYLLKSWWFYYLKLCIHFVDSISPLYMTSTSNIQLVVSWLRELTISFPTDLHLVCLPICTAITCHLSQWWLPFLISKALALLCPTSPNYKDVL